MSKEFLLTDEEINDTILHSPYIMPSSPYERGQGAEQVKKYFYEFIRFFADILNVHLSRIEGESERLDASVAEQREDLLSHDVSDLAHQALVGGLREAVSKAVSSLNSHDQSENAHKALVQSLVTSLTEHNQDQTSHSDIREQISALNELSQNAYNIAMGKSKVVPLECIEDMLEYLDQNQAFSGDVFIFEEENVPDFTYFGQCSSSDGLIVLTYDEYASGSVDIKAGKSYFYNGKKLVASESGFDISTLARAAELARIETELSEEISGLESRLSNLELLADSHERKKTYVTSTDGKVVLEARTEYDLGLQSALTIALPDVIENDYYSILSFRSGANATELSCDEGIYFSGDDCLNGMLYPITKRLYEINVKRVCSLVIAKVSAVDCEVI